MAKQKHYNPLKGALDSRKSEEIVDIEFDSIEHETDKAWLLVIDNDELWLPKSQVEVDERDKIVSMPAWLAEEKGLS